jgi:hypothetical protein
MKIRLSHKPSNGYWGGMWIVSIRRPHCRRTILGTFQYRDQAVSFIATL